MIMKKIFFILLLVVFLAYPTYAFNPLVVCGGVPASGGVTDFTADANCMGAWYMNVSGNELDRSGEGETLTQTSGTIPTSATVPSGYSGTSRDFEFQDSESLVHADGGSTDITGTALSICVWAKIEDDMSDDAMMVSKYNGTETDRQYEFKLDDGDDCIEVIIGWNSGASFQKAQGNTTRSTLSTDWHHHAFVYNGTDIRIYLDGALDTNTDNDLGCDGGADNPCEFTESISDRASPFVVGADYAENNGWDGLLDEVIIFDRALTATEVSDIYTDGIDGTKGDND